MSATHTSQDNTVLDFIFAHNKKLHHANQDEQAEPIPTEEVVDAKRGCWTVTDSDGVAFGYGGEHFGGEKSMDPDTATSDNIFRISHGGFDMAGVFSGHRAEYNTETGVSGRITVYPAQHDGSEDVLPEPGTEGAALWTLAQYFFPSIDNFDNRQDGSQTPKRTDGVGWNEGSAPLVTLCPQWGDNTTTIVCYDPGIEGSDANADDLVRIMETKLTKRGEEGVVRKLSLGKVIWLPKSGTEPLEIDVGEQVDRGDGSETEKTDEQSRLLGGR